MSNSRRGIRNDEMHNVELSCWEWMWKWEPDRREKKAEAPNENQTQIPMKIENRG